MNPDRADSDPQQQGEPGVRKHRGPGFYLMLALAFGNAHGSLAAEPATETEPENVAESEVGKPPVRIYRSPEERREAGLGTWVTDWLRVSGLLELEKEYQKDYYSGDADITESPRPSQAVQIGLELRLLDWLEGEVVLEAEHDKRYHARADEILLSAELDPWGIKLGRQYLPFGEYFSHFVTGPLLEFGETRATSVIVDYAVNDHIELIGYVFDGELEEAGGGRNTDWGISAEIVSDDESKIFGIGYLSDMAESEEPLLEDVERYYEHQVSGWNAYMLLGFDSFEVTGELVRANRNFTELDSHADRPYAWNLEVAWFPADTLQLAMRYEGSRELAEAPEKRYGVALSWAPGKHLVFSVDYLYGRYASVPTDDEEDAAPEQSHTIGAQISMEF